MRTFLIMVIAASLSACTTYSDTLEQKLSGKSPEDKRVILAKECGKETESGLRSPDQAEVEHAKRMRDICHEMTGHNSP